MSRVVGSAPSPDPSGALPDTVRAAIAKEVRMFPPGRQQSALIGSLRAAQEHNGGYLTPDLIAAVAAELDLPSIRAQEVASFYSMLETEPVGRNVISVCTNVSCMLRGSDEILAAAEEKLGIRVGESTPDGRYYLKREEECLAACIGAPMMMVNHRYHENLTPETVRRIIDELQ